MASQLDTAIQPWAGIKARLAKWERGSLELGESEGKWEKGQEGARDWGGGQRAGGIWNYTADVPHLLTTTICEPELHPMVSSFFFLLLLQSPVIV